jgi:hypothetical protein
MLVLCDCSRDSVGVNSCVTEGQALSFLEVFKTTVKPLPEVCSV